MRIHSYSLPHFNAQPIKGVRSFCLQPSNEPLSIHTIYLWRSGQGCPLLRASNEHSFTVRVLRARRAPGRSLRILRRPRVARAQKIISPRPLPCSTHLLKGVAEAALHCAHRTSTFLSCAFCEQEGWLPAPVISWLRAAASSFPCVCHNRNRGGGSGLCAGDSATK